MLLFSRRVCFLFLPFPFTPSFTSTHWPWQKKLFCRCHRTKRTWQNPPRSELFPTSYLGRKSSFSGSGTRIVAGRGNWEDAHVAMLQHTHTYGVAFVTGIKDVRVTLGNLNSATWQIELFPLPLPSFVWDECQRRCKTTTWLIRVEGEFVVSACWNFNNPLVSH